MDVILQTSDGQPVGKVVAVPPFLKHAEAILWGERAFFPYYVPMPSQATTAAIYREGMIWVAPTETVRDA